MMMMMMIIIIIIIIIIGDSGILTERFKDIFGIHTKKLDSLQKTAILGTSHLKL